MSTVQDGLRVGKRRYTYTEEERTARRERMRLVATKMWETRRKAKQNENTEQDSTGGQDTTDSQTQESGNQQTG